MFRVTPEGARAPLGSRRVPPPAAGAVLSRRGLGRKIDQREDLGSARGGACRCPLLRGTGHAHGAVVPSSGAYGRSRTAVFLGGLPDFFEDCAPEGRTRSGFGSGTSPATRSWP